MKAKKKKKEEENPVVYSVSVPTEVERTEAGLTRHIPGFLQTTCPQFFTLFFSFISLALTVLLSKF